LGREVVRFLRALYRHLSQFFPLRDLQLPQTPTTPWHADRFLIRVRRDAAFGCKRLAFLATMCLQVPVPLYLLTPWAAVGHKNDVLTLTYRFLPKRQISVTGQQEN